MKESRTHSQAKYLESHGLKSKTPSPREANELHYRLWFKIESDLQDSYDYYEQQLHGLGLDFLMSVEATLNHIARDPLHFQKVHKNKRKANLKRFPFGIFYIISKEYIIILAVIHLTRDPKVWRKRKV